MYHISGWAYPTKTVVSGQLSENVASHGKHGEKDGSVASPSSGRGKEIIDENKKFENGVWVCVALVESKRRYRDVKEKVATDGDSP